MPGRRFGTIGRYAFNSKEQDEEVKGKGVQYDYGFRIYDSRLGKFLSVDPLTKDYPWYTPYQFAGNKPIQFIDLDGLEEAPPKTAYNNRTSAKDYEFHDSQNPHDEYASIFKDEIWPSTLERYDGTWTYTRMTNGQTYHYWLDGNRQWHSYEPEVSKAPKMPRNMLYLLFVESFERALNPIENIDVYVSGSIKKKVDLNKLGLGNISLPKNTTATIVIGGIQGGYTTNDNQGLYGNMILGNNSYLSYTTGKTEVRGLPLRGMLNVDMDGSQPKYGDYAPELRVLQTVGTYRGVPIQAEIALGIKPSVGVRAKIETPNNIAGYALPFSAEVSGGARFSLKVPGLIKALFK